MFPEISITSSINIPTYYFVLSLAVCLSLPWLVSRANKQNLSRKLTLDLSLIIMIAAFIGARLFHVFYEEFNYYLDSPLLILEFWNGGFVYYGGALTATIAGLFYVCKKARAQKESYLDLFAPIFAFTYLLGRLGCFLAGCCYGKSCELPWAINDRHPTQLYAAFWELGVLIILLIVERTPPKERKPDYLARPGSIFYLWLTLHGIGRLLMETYRDDFRGPSWGLSISSWISSLIILLGVHLMSRKTT